jgi:hypothetical protein
MFFGSPVLVKNHWGHYVVEAGETSGSESNYITVPKKECLVPMFNIQPE